MINNINRYLSTCILLGLLLMVLFVAERRLQELLFAVDRYLLNVTACTSGAVIVSVDCFLIKYSYFILISKNMTIAIYML